MSNSVAIAATPSSVRGLSFGPDAGERASITYLMKSLASDFHFQHLRANNLVMWEAIKHLAVAGCESLHLGRTSLSNEGLRRFKLGFGAREERIEYRKYDFRRESFVTDTDRAESWVNLLFKLFPEPLLRLAGAMVYPHLS